jgi:hypothetical protein
VGCWITVFRGIQWPYHPLGVCSRGGQPEPWVSVHLQGTRTRKQILQENVGLEIAGSTISGESQWANHTRVFTTLEGNWSDGGSHPGIPAGFKEQGGKSCKQTILGNDGLEVTGSMVWVGIGGQMIAWMFATGEGNPLQKGWGYLPRNTSQGARRPIMHANHRSVLWLGAHN